MKKTSSVSVTIFLLCFFLLQACIPMRKVVYMKNNPIIEKEINTSPPVHHLEIGDVLFVRIISQNDKTHEFFNVETNTNSSINNTSMASLYLNGSTINSAGIIEIPVIGEIYLLGQDLEQAKKSIQKTVDEYLKDAIVIVKLTNFQVTILGEVKNAGTFPVFKESLTVFEALAMAGDLTDYANRQKIKIVRTHKNKKKINLIDLTDQQLLLSDFYYLRNDDMIYVEPLKYRTFRKSQSQVVLSALTTLALVVNVLLKINE
ncbi:MAG: polysaccharide biosynthesis/export family protein [Bacteroidota bacterium]|nr:polysaccharide biosynthesis/export family protein [Bacteroidota bacterium]